jgi:hypothetical protein
MPGGIPDFVINDLSEQTIKRYLTDPEFRQALLSDPVATNASAGLDLSPATIEWINERVAHHGLANLLTGPVPEVPTA